jgi:hypothetical protein
MLALSCERADQLDSHQGLRQVARAVVPFPVRDRCSDKSSPSYHRTVQRQLPDCIKPLQLTMPWRRKPIRTHDRSAVPNADDHSQTLRLTLISSQPQELRGAEFWQAGGVVQGIRIERQTCSVLNSALWTCAWRHHPDAFKKCAACRHHASAELYPALRCPPCQSIVDCIAPRSLVTGTRLAWV